MQFGFTIQSRQINPNQLKYDEPAFEITVNHEEYAEISRLLEALLSSPLNYTIVDVDESLNKKIIISLRYIDPQTEKLCIASPLALEGYLSLVKDFLPHEKKYILCKNYVFFIEAHKKRFDVNAFTDYQQRLEADFPELLALQNQADNIISANSTYLNLLPSDLQQYIKHLFLFNAKPTIPAISLKPVRLLSHSEFNSSLAMLQDILLRNKTLTFFNSNSGDVVFTFCNSNKIVIQNLISQLKNDGIIDFRYIAASPTEPDPDAILEFRITHCDFEKLSKYHAEFINSDDFIKEENPDFSMFTM